MSINLNSCGNNVQDILHLLAAAIVEDANGVKHLRMNITVHECSEIEAGVNCSNSHVKPEVLLKEVIFTDDCGDNLIINISVPEIPS